MVLLSNSALDGILQFSMTKDSLLNEDIRRKYIGRDNAQALITENRGRSKSRDSKGHGRFRSQSKEKEQIKYYFCDKKGHIRKHCKAWKNK